MTRLWEGDIVIAVKDLDLWSGNGTEIWGLSFRVLVVDVGLTGLTHNVIDCALGGERLLVGRLLVVRRKCSLTRLWKGNMAGNQVRRLHLLIK